MADGDRAAVDVVLLVIDTQGVAAVQALRGEGLVELPQVDIGNLQPFCLEQARYGVDGTDAHLFRLTTGHGEATEERTRLEAELDGLVQAHHQRHRGAVGQLRRVAGGHRTVLGESRLEAGEAFQGGVRTVAVVTVDHTLMQGALAGVLVLGEILHVHRHDFVAEQPFGLGTRGALLALQ